MNTKTDSTVDTEEIIEATEATVAKKPRKKSRGKLTNVKLLRGIEDGEKITPQIKQCIEAALDAHKIGAEITPEEFITSLAGKLITRQPDKTIFRYYIADMETLGLVELTYVKNVPKAKLAAKSPDLDDGEDVTENVDGGLEDAKVMALQLGSTIGIIGGGQLARMLAMAAARLGFRVAVLEPQEDCPAAQVANIHLAYDYDDEAGLSALAEVADVITYEFENVPVGAAQYLERKSRLYPSSKALEISQDRLIEKDFLNQLGIDTAGYFDISNVQDLNNALKTFDGGGILKTRRLGYDGKGQVQFEGDDIARVEAKFAEFGDTPCILEQMVNFEREISVIAARNASGIFSSYDPACNTHRDGILWRSVVPCGVTEDIAAMAIEVARKIMDELTYVGVMGTEFFVTDSGKLLVNEIAPRVHNSGHWTEAACTISQFEQHIRAIAGWPLLDITRHSDCVMENIIGNEVDEVQTSINVGSQMLHLYGKSEVRAGRKMGHITRISPRCD